MSAARAAPDTETYARSVYLDGRAPKVDDFRTVAEGNTGPGHCVVAVDPVPECAALDGYASPEGVIGPAIAP